MSMPYQEIQVLAHVFIVFLIHKSSKSIAQPILHGKKSLTCCNMLLRAGLNNVVLPTLLKVVKDGEQHCYTPFSLRNIDQC